MKTFEEVEAFVRKAMENNLFVRNQGDTAIEVNNNDYRVSVYSYNIDARAYHINISVYKDSSRIKVGEFYITIECKDALKFKLLVLDCKKYADNKATEVINNFFFKIDGTTPIDNLLFD